MAFIGPRPPTLGVSACPVDSSAPRLGSCRYRRWTPPAESVARRTATSSPDSAADRGGTTTTGQPACIAHASLTEPSAACRMLETPWVPTTSNCARCESCTSTSTASPWTSSYDTGGGSSISRRTPSTTWRADSSACCRAWIACSSADSPSLPRGGQALTASIAQRRSRPSSSAQRSARRDPSDPSMPTAITPSGTGFCMSPVWQPAVLRVGVQGPAVASLRPARVEPSDVVDRPPVECARLCVEGTTLSMLET